jgi:amino acid permease
MIAAIFEGVTWLGVVLGMAAAMAWGALYYSPVLFAKAWMAEMGKTPEELGNPAKALANAPLMNLIAALGINIVLVMHGDTTLGGAIAVAIFLWIVFCLTTELLHDRYNGMSAKLSLINAGNTLGAYIAMGIVIQLLR